MRHWQQKHAPVLGSHEPYAELDGCQPVHIWESPPPFRDAFVVLKTAEFSKPAEAF